MRQEHEFHFSAAVIAKAATEEAQYHREREAYWRSEYETSIQRVKETAGVKFIEREVTGGKRIDIVVDYGDPAAYSRMQESFNKIESHMGAAERYESDARVYGTQSRSYTLSPEDVHYFHLGGEPRSE